MTDFPGAVDRSVLDPAKLTVTLFGDHDAIDQAISDELSLRGCRTHSVSVETGWLSSTTKAIVRLDTPAGMSALEGLTDADSPIIQIVAICADPADSPHAEQLRRLCEECSTNHEVSLIWHDPLVETPLAVQPEADGADRPLRHLAAVVVDEVTDEASATPSFSTRSIAG